MVCAGNSCSAIATSPKARSRSTRQTSRRPPSASDGGQVGRQRRLAAAALGGEDGDDHAAAAGPRPSPGRRRVWRIARASVRVRRTAAFSPARSRSSTTSRQPARSASASTGVSMRRRTRTTPRLGRLTRMLSLRCASAALQVDRRTEDDGVLTEVDLEVAAQGSSVGRTSTPGPSADRRSPPGRVGFDDDTHVGDS